MNLQPFFEASTAIQIHMIAAIISFFLGFAVLWRKKGGKLHKFSGRIWVALMMVTSISALFIHEIRMWGNFSPIHILSITTPIGLIAAIIAIRKRDLAKHKSYMQNTFLFGMVVAGGFTFMPGRLMNRIVFGGSERTGFSLSLMSVSAMVVVLVALFYWWRWSAGKNERAKV